MAGTFLRTIIVLALVVAIVGLIGLFIMAGVAGTHDVVSVPVPSDGYLASLKHDYVDAYRAPLRFNTYRDIDRLSREAFRLGGVEVYRSEHEIVYEGYRAGIRYYLSYTLDWKTSPNTLTMVTLVRLHGTDAEYAWKAVKPIHKRLSPYLLDRMAQAATD